MIDSLAEMQTISGAFRSMILSLHFQDLASPFVSPTFSLQGCVKTYFLIGLRRCHLHLVRSNSKIAIPTFLGNYRPPSCFIRNFALTLCNRTTFLISLMLGEGCGQLCSLFLRHPRMRAFLLCPGQNQSWHSLSLAEFGFSDTRILLERGLGQSTDTAKRN